MTAQHTPGPWQSIHLHGKHYCVAEQKNGVGLLYNEANARLIATAPDLLDAVLDILGQLEAVGLLIDGEDCGQWHGAEGLSFAKAREAIAKATGDPVMAA